MPTPCRDLKTRFFDFSQRDIDGEATVSSDAGFLALFTARGAVEMDGRTVTEETSVLLPPNTSVTLRAVGARVLLTRVISPMRQDGRPEEEK